MQQPNQACLQVQLSTVAVQVLSRAKSSMHRVPF